MHCHVSSETILCSENFVTDRALDRALAIGSYPAIANTVKFHMRLHSISVVTRLSTNITSEKFVDFEARGFCNFVQKLSVVGVAIFEDIKSLSTGFYFYALFDPDVGLAETAFFRVNVDAVHVFA